MEDNIRRVDEGRRKFIRKAAYVAPSVLALSAMPFSASYGSQITQNTSWGGGQQVAQNKPMGTLSPIKQKMPIKPKISARFKSRGKQYK